jgi:hypothetical protein
MGWFVLSESKRIWYEVFVAHFKVMSRSLLVGLPKITKTGTRMARLWTKTGI